MDRSKQTMEKVESLGEQIQKKPTWIGTMRKVIEKKVKEGKPLDTNKPKGQQSC